MNTGEYIKRAWPILIETTGHPMAPIILQEAFSRIDALARLMVTAGADSDKTKVYTSQLMEHWVGNRINSHVSRPEFILALCSLISSSIEDYVKSKVN